MPTPDEVGHHRRRSPGDGTDDASAPPVVDRTIAGLLLVGSFLVYLAVSRGKYVAYDAASMVGVAHDLVNHFSLRASNGFHDYLHLSTPYSPYGIGVSLLLVPFYALSKAVGHEALLLSLINPAIVAATATCCFAIGRCLRWSRWLAVLASLSFGLLTMAFQSTTELFSEPAVGLCIAVMVWGVLRWRDQWQHGSLVVGLTAGAVIQFRADSVFTVWIGLLALPLFVPWRTILERANVLRLALPLLISLGLLGAYNEVRWHSFLQFSYNGQGFSTPLGRGIEGLVFSPGKSLFVYNPLALLGLIGLVLLFRRDRAVGFLFVMLIVPRLLFFARWDSWEGGVDWGPRFLMPVILLLVIAAVEVLHRFPRSSFRGIVARVAFVVLAVVSAGLSALSVRVPYEQWIETLSTPALIAPLEGRQPIVPHRARPEAVQNAYDFTIRASQIRGELLLLQRGEARFAPAYLAGADAVAGWVLLSAGLCDLGAASVLAVKRDRREQRSGRPSADVPSESDGGPAIEPAVAAPLSA